MLNFLKSNISKEEVIETIKDFLNGTGGAYDWGDFLCVNIRDEDLDEIRQECNELSERYPSQKKGEFCSEEGIVSLKKILNLLENS